MAKYPKLSATLNKDEYKAFEGKLVMFQGRVTKVTTYSSESQYGSWERGFKWTHTTYGVLKRGTKRLLGTEISFDHGATWHTTYKDAKRSKGKVILGKEKSKEFAFDSIQDINRRWDGPTYVWRP